MDKAEEDEIDSGMQVVEHPENELNEKDKQIEEKSSDLDQQVVDYVQSTVECATMSTNGMSKNRMRMTVNHNCGIVISSKNVHNVETPYTLNIALMNR